MNTKCNTESRATMNCYLSLESRMAGSSSHKQKQNSLASLRSAYTSTCWGAHTVCLSHLQLKSPSHSGAMLTWCNDSQLWNKQLRCSETGGRDRRSETWPSTRILAETGIWSDCEFLLILYGRVQSSESLAFLRDWILCVIGLLILCCLSWPVSTKFQKQC